MSPPPGGRAWHKVAPFLGSYPTRDIELFGAFTYTLMGDKSEALRSLKTYLAANPERRETLAEDAGWWFRSLQEDPRFKELVGVKQ